MREQVQALRALTEPDAEPALGGADTPPPKQDAASFSQTVSGVSEGAFNTQHATANTRPLEPVRAKSRAWFIALGVLLLGAGGVAIARFGTIPTAEPVVSEPVASEPNAASASASTAHARGTPSSEPESTAPRGESEPATEPDGRSAEPGRTSPPNPRPPSAKTAAAPPTSTRAKPAAEKPASKPTAPSAPKGTSAKPPTTGTPQVDLGI